ncbi:MAG: tRNA (adenosine(37)-N6)-threonylcarbamoyltransferase complex dimerization subunit type 1 TsaB [Bacteroidota bacterium]|nr:tRNA (adenosine(37)-N6)-threonylcarbamoyltransferase complex dimerization subunit type 1 TsaB [Bacteroidota bacterium]
MILAIETATEVCSVALVHHGDVVSSRSVNEKNVHSERLLSLIDAVLVEAHKKPKDIEEIAVSIGPGSFTGLRIGLSTAKGFAMAVNIPILAVPTLDGLAEEYRRTRSSVDEETFCALIDAKRSESFFAFYTISKNKIHRLTEYSITLKEEILASATARNAKIDQPLCNAVSVGLYAETNKKELKVSDFSHLEPMYLREFVATTPKKQLLH